MSKFLLVVVLFTYTNTFAAVNKWIDEQGHVHYSDQPPPPHAKAETLHITPGNEGNTASASAPAAPKTIAEREAELKKAKQAKQDAAVKAAQKNAAEDAKKANCSSAQQNLRALQEGIRMVEIDANGERSYLDDKQRQERITQAQQDISNFCK